ncbi:GDSL-type esterase/lipase family protein [Roseimaritima ulvae]|uniref:SGNH hydrolase-type esterase domain-containing protein n=1 Tax=Roseimaritima ulvae TaxID=980254 RepID=A0A5B9R2S3_9BACT|nr:GDSL-type esterase/lipase family protein [Roseimaritima ulvae]QEG40613.1 hypothetical protein UC8_26290 [Roseimaritima ulvae]
MRSLFLWLTGCVSVGVLLASPAVVRSAEPDSKNVHLRGDLQNARIAFAGKQKACVAFIGGSITEMNGYRPMVAAELQSRFPDTEFEFINAGISSTCSTSGAFRLRRDVLAHQPDLLFVEFAVNDDQDAAHAARECRRGMEGILRQAWMHDPELDIVITHFVNPPMLEKLTAGKTPTSSGQHEAVAEHYGVSSSDLARELAQRIAAGTFSWQQYGGTHPKQAGNRLAADLIVDLLDAAWAQPLPADAQPTAHSLPAPLDENSYFRGRFVSPADAKADDAWKWDRPDWSEIAGGFRDTFRNEMFLHTSEVGAELSLEFEGTAVGAFVLAGPDAGMVEVSVDGAKPHVVDLYHHFSKGLHYPRTVMFATDLPAGKHQLRLRVSGKHNDQSHGHAVRIMQFTAN